MTNQIPIHQADTPCVDEPPKPKKSRARKPKIEKLNPAASLIAALKFIRIAQSKAGTLEQQYCIIGGHWAAAFNGILMAACKVEEDLNAIPHTLQLLDALQKCGDEMNITQLSANTLSIKSGEFKALVSCLSQGFAIPAPDPLIAPIDDRIKFALETVLPLATDGAPNAAYASVLLQAQTAVATNGAALLEAFHGWDLPPGLMLPKASATAITKGACPLIGFGYSANSATFYYENGSFIKTQLFNENYPNYLPLFKDVNAWQIPDKFFTAVHAIETFSTNGIVYFDKSAVSSHEQETQASTYQIEGLPEGMAFSAKLLTQVEHAFKKVEFDKEANKAYFFGDNVRGILMAVNQKNEPAAFNPIVRKDIEDFEDDIPF